MSEAPPIAVRAAPADNVATLLAPAAAGVEVSVLDGKARDASAAALRTRAPVAMGHKVALEAIDAGDLVRKYGVPFGRARAAIAPGEHVHVHNVQSLLGSTGRDPGGGEERPCLVPVEDLRARVTACLQAARATDAAAEAMADALVEAHLRGSRPTGCGASGPTCGACAPAAWPRARSRGSRATPVCCASTVATRSVTTPPRAPRMRSTRAAAEHGVAVALVRHSNHFGFAGYYATRIAQAGCAALVSSNGQVMVGPEGAQRPLFSNDPLAIACPLADGTCLEFDMAFSVTSRAKVVQAGERGDPVPEGVALDASGNPTTDAAAAAAGILLPFGGTRGFAFLAALEMLTGVLGGGAYADGVASKEAGDDTPEDASHFLLAIDLERAGGREAFVERMADLVARIHALPLRAGDTPLRYPGERRWQLRARRLAEGIPLSSREAADLEQLCGELGVAR
ncbi:MAG: Ldh family oxidoreductase [Halofilum sp. (in: g-proteobacteria)]|nr:Ldh family oxidoreductase [Halofilum sp. (in: g-proteobacteria)]